MHAKRLGRQFNANCARQGITLESSLEAGIENGTLGKIVTHTPGPLFAGISQAAYLRRNKPDRPLTNKPLDPELFVRRNEMTTRCLVDLINSSIQGAPVSTSEKPRAEFTKPTGKYADCCAYAEESFAKRIQKLADGEDAQCDIVMAGLQAVMIRKRTGESTSLTLAPIKIDDITYPAGSIVRAALTDDDPTESWNDKIWVNNNLPGVRYARVSDVNDVNFLRLSAFSIPVSDRFPIRSKYGWGVGFDDYKSSLMDVEEVAQVAQNAFEQSLAA